MNKQSIKLLKQAAYYIKKAEFEKQSGIKGKNMAKAWEAGGKAIEAGIEGAQRAGKAISEGASEAAKKSYEYAGKLWNRFRGNTPKEIQEVPKEIQEVPKAIEPSTPKLESWQHPAPTVSDVPYNYPKRIPDLELFVPYWGEWRKFPVPDYMQGWSPEEAKYYSKLREFETAPDSAYNKLVS